eukprot:TRINITY_DN12931_c0_g1_i1.p1 TRINITY_DN12931_c0_g1~~TRINITY_DN12931_c0_g1_i1.p1  ORF type:complete len:351 (+),score=98.09 TRINITY_DN12931_c0_g1_i1:28-1053(+)
MLDTLISYAAISAFLLVAAFIPYIYIQVRALKRVPQSLLNGKAILVTGCDTGFGFMTSREIAKNESLTVFAGCLTQKGIEELRSLSPPNLIPFPLDVTSQESIDKAYELVSGWLSKNGHSPSDGLFALVNNAGVLRAQLVETTPIEEMHLMMNVNVIGMAMMVKKFLPILRNTKNSRIINIASVAGRLACAGIAAYSASKFAVEAFSDSLRREVNVWGVKVSIIEPGIMKTPLYDASIKDTIDKQWNNYSESVRESYGREYFDKMYVSGTKLVEFIGGNPQKVVDSLVWCINSDSPPHRVSVGHDAPFWILLSYLPSWISDVALQIVESGNPIPAAAQKAQ